MLIADLREVFKEVNSRFVYTTEDKEYWPGREALNLVILGDCEDFALTCRAECRKRDIKSRLVHCKTEIGEHHIVLESNGWILDNRQKAPMSRVRLNYEWISISGYETDEPWREIV